MAKAKKSPRKATPRKALVSKRTKSSVKTASIPRLNASKGKDLFGRRIEPSDDVKSHDVASIDASMVVTPKNIDVHSVSGQKDEVPAFIDVNDKNLRNNLGYKIKGSSALNDELEKVNERLNAQLQKHHHPDIHAPAADAAVGKRRDPDTLPRVISYSFVALVIIALIVVIYIAYSSRDVYVEEGICKVRMQTYEEGKKETVYLDIGHVKCNTQDECRKALIKMSFSFEDIEKMTLRCEPVPA